MIEVSTANMKLIFLIIIEFTKKVVKKVNNTQKVKILFFKYIIVYLKTFFVTCRVVV